MEDAQVLKLRAWSYRLQGLHRPDVIPLTTLENVVAVYSSQPTAPLSLLARTSALDADRFMELERAREAIRLPAMRGSVFLMPSTSASFLLSATRTPRKQLQGRLEYGGFTWDDYERVKVKFLECAVTPKTTDELNELIPVDGKLMVAIRLLSYEGLALRVAESLRGDSFRYVSAPSWLGGPLADHDPDEALMWLASEYLRAFGPVRPDDFAWWAGLTKTRARKAVASLPTVDIDDRLLLLGEDFDEFQSCVLLDGDEIALLPKWDPYTMGYPTESRARFVDNEHLDKAYPKIRATRGDGAPLVLRGGKAVASWGHRFSGDRMTVTVTPFDASERVDWLSASHFAGIAGLLGATDLTLTTE
jgi:hypothetical protein